MVQASLKNKKSRRAGSREKLTLPTLDNLFEGHLTEVLIATGAHCDDICCLFFIADDQQVRQLSYAMFAYFISNFLVPQIRFNAEAA